MKVIYIFVCCFLFSACDNRKAEIDKSSPEYNARVDHIKDSLHERLQQNLTTALIDTVGLFRAPVLVLSAKPETREYSAYKDIRLSYKNVSGKTISAIRFKWYGINAFNEAADMGGTIRGFSGGFTDDILRDKKSTTSSWNLLSNDLKKVVLAWPSEVVFNDGSNWKIGKLYN